MDRDSRDDTRAAPDDWPALPLAEWKPTCDTLHMWAQVVGKIALAQAPMINHWWQTTLRLTARGLTTLPLPYGRREFQVGFDFVDHELYVEASDGSARAFALRAMPVADFYRQTMDTLASLGIEVEIWTTPVEVEDRTPFEADYEHASYDPDYANRFWKTLLLAGRVFQAFRSRYLGKVSPVQFFWGSFDLAVTRFSGRKAPAYAGGAFNVSRKVMEEAYSHEVSSLGFWPGSDTFPYPAFYSYAVPAPVGFAEAHVSPAGANFNHDLGEFVLSYDDVRTAEHPDDAVLTFAQSTYAAAADLGHWPRSELERQASTHQTG